MVVVLQLQVEVEEAECPSDEFADAAVVLDVLDVLVVGVEVVRLLHVDADEADRKSTRLNSSHTVISYAVFCLKKKIIASLIALPVIFFSLFLRKNTA